MKCSCHLVSISRRGYLCTVSCKGWANKWLWCKFRRVLCFQNALDKTMNISVIMGCVPTRFRTSIFSEFRSDPLSLEYNWVYRTMLLTRYIAFESSPSLCTLRYGFIENKHVWYLLDTFSNPFCNPCKLSVYTLSSGIPQVLIFTSVWRHICRPFVRKIIL